MGAKLVPSRASRLTGVLETLNVGEPPSRPQLVRCETVRMTAAASVTANKPNTGFEINFIVI